MLQHSKGSWTAQWYGQQSHVRNKQKMCAADRQVWARDLERKKKPPTLNALMSWMTVEIKSRMRATAPIRVSGSNRKQINHLQGNQNKDDQAWYKCCLCKNSKDWPDQCPTFAALSVDDRIAFAKANHLWFSCLKRAGRGHTMGSCRCKQQCTQPENGTRCSQHHHPQLHKSNTVKISAATLGNMKKAIFPVLGSANGLFKYGNVLLDSGA